MFLNCMHCGCSSAYSLPAAWRRASDPTCSTVPAVAHNLQTESSQSQESALAADINSTTPFCTDN